MEKRIVDGGVPVLPCSLARLLPPSITQAIADRVPEGGGVEEILLRAGKQAFAVCGGRNVPLDVTVSDKTLTELLLAVCGGSLYAHADTVRRGFVTLSDGIRVGVAGRAVTEEGRIVAVTDVTTLCFRIPRSLWVDPTVPVSMLRSFSLTRGILLFSPPGGGKTTALRSIVRTLAAGESPFRVAVIDTRCELAPFLSAKGLCVDILSGYPRRDGIEIAARTLDAEVIVCDEICGMEEARTIAELQGGGAVLVATAHAADIEGLLSRTDMALLHRTGTFGAYLRVDRYGDELYTVYPREKVAV